MPSRIHPGILPIFTLTAYCLIQSIGCIGSMSIKDIFVWISCLVIALAVLLTYFWSSVNTQIERIQSAHVDLAQVRELSEDYRDELHEQTGTFNRFIRQSDDALLQELSKLRAQFGWRHDPWNTETAPEVSNSMLKKAVSFELNAKKIELFKRALDSANRLFKAQNAQITEIGSSEVPLFAPLQNVQNRENDALDSIQKLVQHTKFRTGVTIDRAHKRIAYIKPIITVLFAPLLAVLVGTVAVTRKHVWLGFDSIREAIIEMADRDDFNMVLGLARNDEVGDMARAVATLREKTQSRLDRLHDLAFHDSLTGLENRTQLHDQLEDALNASRVRGEQICIFIIDLDKFKEVNDVYGHLIGDRVLKETARRLIDCAPPDALVSRFGGDEFAVFARLNEAETSVEELGEALASRLRAPVPISKSAWVSCAGTIGIAQASDEDLDADDLMSKADAALYVAKDQRRGTSCMYRDGMEQAMRRRRAMQDDLASAISTGQLRLNYQPQYEVGHDKLVGFEALLRWNHPKFGDISPADFIPIAEDTPLIIAIGRFCIAEAIKFASHWKNPTRISINLSPGQFYDLNLVSFIKETLQAHRFPPHLFEIEITEGLLIADMTRAKEILDDLRSQGIQIALDDFGTGYSALSYLRTIPADRIKIDKSFVDPIEEDPKAQTILKSIIMIAKTVQMEVIAEGVETPVQREILKIAGCNEIQGYLTGKPLSLEDAKDLIEANRNKLFEAFDEDSRAEQHTTQLDPRTGNVA